MKGGVVLRRGIARLNSAPLGQFLQRARYWPANPPRRFPRWSPKVKPQSRTGVGLSVLEHYETLITSKLLSRFPCAALALLLLAISLAPARAQLVSSLSVLQDMAPSGLFRYTYTLANDAASTQYIPLFQLNVALNADLQALSNTVGRDVTYIAGAPSVIWTSATLTPTTCRSCPISPSSRRSMLHPSATPTDQADAGAGQAWHY
jgi:hypothetical protein